LFCSFLLDPIAEWHNKLKIASAIPDGELPVEGGVLRFSIESLLARN
jgi:hypothetical protein